MRHRPAPSPTIWVARPAPSALPAFRTSSQAEVIGTDALARAAVAAARGADAARARLAQHAGARDVAAGAARARRRPGTRRWRAWRR